MVMFLYAAAAAFLLALGFVAESPFAKTDLLVLAVASFILARFVRIERRLDRIGGVQRTAKSKRLRMWLWSHREMLFAVVGFLYCGGLLWYDWPKISQSLHSVQEAAHKGRIPWLHVILCYNSLTTALFVSFPLGAFCFAIPLLALIGFYVVCVATILGYPKQIVYLEKPRYDFVLGTYSLRKNAAQAVMELLFEIWSRLSVWFLFLIIFARDEATKFFDVMAKFFGVVLKQIPYPHIWILAVLAGGWFPVLFVARRVQKQREGHAAT